MVKNDEYRLWDSEKIGIKLGVEHPANIPFTGLW